MNGGPEQEIETGTSVRFPVPSSSSSAGVLFRGRPDDPSTLSEVIGQAIGAASVCWESMRNTGVFQDDRARAILIEVLEWIEERYEPRPTLVRVSEERARAAREVASQMLEPNLGYATNLQLLDELRTRIEVHGPGLRYRTVDGGEKGEQPPAGDLCNHPRLVPSRPCADCASKPPYTSPARPGTNGEQGGRTED